MLRGEVWWADLGLARGSAPARRRPVVIISADAYNRSMVRTVTVAAMTTNTGLALVPGNVAVPAAAAGLAADSVVNVTQVATVDRAALGERAGRLPEWLLESVDAGLSRALGLTPR